MRRYVRIAGWLLLGYLLWCFGPALYAATRFRLELFKEVSDGAVSGRPLKQIREDIQYKADELKIPLKPEDLDVSLNAKASRITASYAYTQTATSFGKTFNLDFHGSTWAETNANYTNRSPTGN